MMCQRTTTAVNYMFHALRYAVPIISTISVVQRLSDKSTTTLNAFGDLFSSLGVQSSPNKDCPPSTSKVFLGIHIDTLAMSMSITPERLQELLHRCFSVLFLSYISCHNLQSLHPPCPYFHVNPSQHPLHSPGLSPLLSIRQQVRPLQRHTSHQDITLDQ